MAPVAAEEGPEGEDRQAGGTVVPPFGEEGRGATGEAPMLEDHTMAASSRPTAGEV